MSEKFKRHLEDFIDEHSEEIRSPDKLKKEKLGKEYVTTLCNFIHNADSCGDNSSRFISEARTILRELLRKYEKYSNDFVTRDRQSDTRDRKVMTKIHKKLTKLEKKIGMLKCALLGIAEEQECVLLNIFTNAAYLGRHDRLKEIF
jgi:DNA-binding ferritin-like protein